MAHFAQRFRLDLANPLAGNSKLAADLFQGPAISVDQAEALFENLAFTFGQRLKHILDLFLQQHNRRHVAGVFSALVFDEVAEIRLLAFANRRLKRNRLLRHLQNRSHSIYRQQDFLRHFLRGWFAAVFLDQLLLHPHQFVDRLDHMDGDANGARLIGNGPSDGLSDPPGGVGRKFVAAPIFKFLDRFH